MSNISTRLKAAKAQLKSAQKAVDQLEKEYDGDAPSPDQARLFKKSVSYTVQFERRKALKKVRSPGMVCKSLRRFSSRKEAEQHGRRFAKKHGHKSYTVVKTNKRPNAWINWRTGKTNPVVG